MNRPSSSARPIKGLTEFETSPADTFTAYGTKFASERQFDLLGDRDARLVLRLKGGSTEVGHDHHRRQLKEGRLGRWLLLEHVECGTLDVTLANGFGEVGFVDDAAAPPR